MADNNSDLNLSDSNSSTSSTQGKKLSKSARRKLKREAERQKREQEALQAPPTTNDTNSGYVMDQSVVEEATRDMAFTINSNSNQQHNFWDTQPVPRMEEKVVLENKAIDKVKTVDEIQKTPYALKGDYKWVETDLDDPKVLDEVYNLLALHYVTDDDGMFRFDYPKSFLLWALKPPGYRKDWHIGVRATTNNKLCAFITAIPAKLRVFDKVLKVVEINFLCIHKKLRTKRLAPILIKEITRRVNLTDCWQAVYTAGRVLPRPVSICRYYHRSLNPKKLIDVGFTALRPRMTMKRTLKLFSVPPTPQIPGIREFKKEDAAQVQSLLEVVFNKRNMAPKFNLAEICHWFTPVTGVVNSYVVEDPETHKITDFISFYHLPSTIIGHNKYNTLRAAYSFYNATTDDSEERWCKVMNDALIFAKQVDMDVFNALDVMENKKFLEELKFGAGDGSLHFYLYNWQCPSMTPEKTGLVLM